jgi:hypothetical protein
MVEIGLKEHAEKGGREKIAERTPGLKMSLEVESPKRR